MTKTIRQITQDQNVISPITTQSYLATEIAKSKCKPQPRNNCTPSIGPFFQWVGGKRRIVDLLIEKIPQGLNNYYEPFLGGGWSIIFPGKGQI